MSVVNQRNKICKQCDKQFRRTCELIKYGRLIQGDESKMVSSNETKVNEISLDTAFNYNHKQGSKMNPLSTANSYGFVLQNYYTLNVV